MNIRRSLILLAALSFSATLQAKSPLEAKMESIQRAEDRRLKAQDYYGIVRKSIEESNFEEAIANSYRLLKEYPTSVLASETIYLQALSFFEAKEYHLADQAFTRYLQDYSSLKHFEDAIRYKFKIAEKFGSGYKKRLFGGRRSPKILSGTEDALRIYDEVITTLPRNDLAAHSLYNKGEILIGMQNFKEAIEAFQTLVKRFPKHPLAPESYLAISHAYLEQCEKEFPDPNLIALAEMNFQAFQGSFPGESRLVEAGETLVKMQDRFAKDLYFNAKYYEKKKKEKAAFLYYSNILMKYPTSSYAAKAQARIAHLKSHSKKADELVI